ncbi:MAG: cation:proton antiporter [Firmicutes bacterium HGW-Firmicutes-5]|nr:MAG: cation:proton antiporter [Firmicutes bacterium HGW-Firmicutes-5]
MTIVFALIGVGILLSALRLFKGPSTMDRIVGIDTINMMVVGVIGVLAVYFKNGLYLDIAIVYAVLAFLETVVIARYMEGRQ